MKLSKCDKCENLAVCYYMNFQHIPLFYCELHDPYKNYEQKFEKITAENDASNGIFVGYTKRSINA
jgi:hypothetical protein